jgi:hypothetical protein
VSFPLPSTSAVFSLFTDYEMSVKGTCMLNNIFVLVLFLFIRRLCRQFCISVDLHDDSVVI